MAIFHVRLGAVEDSLGDEDLVGSRDRLGPGGGVHYRADRGQVTVRSAELAKTQFAGMDADADSQFTRGEAVRFDKALAPSAPVRLNFARSEDGVSGMLLPPQGKVEDRHDGVSDRLVEEPVMLPDRTCAFIVECVEQA